MTNKDNKWYKLGYKMGGSPLVMILIVILVIVLSTALIVGGIALEGAILYCIETILFPLMGWSISITYIQCCAIVLVVEILVGILKNIFGKQD